MFDSLKDINYTNIKQFIDLWILCQRYERLEIFAYFPISTSQNTAAELIKKGERNALKKNLSVAL